MTLAEFKAWFEGYTEGLETAPTKAQFDRIKEKVKEIDGTVTTHTVYLDRYVHTWPYHSWPYLTPTISGYGYATGGGTYQVSNNIGGAWGGQTIEANSFDPIPAMYALGKAEAIAA